MREALIAGLVGALLACGVLGCGRSSVVFATATTFGVEVSATAQNQGTVSVGFERIEGVSMPLFQETRVPWLADENAERSPGLCRTFVLRYLLCKKVRRERVHDGYSTLAAIRVDTGGLVPEDVLNQHVDVAQVFATGAAAEDAQAIRVASLILKGGGPSASDRQAAKGLIDQAADATAGDHARKIIGQCLAGDHEAVGDAAAARLLVEEALEHAAGRRSIRDAVSAMQSIQPGSEADACPAS